MHAALINSLVTKSLRLEHQQAQNKKKIATNLCFGTFITKLSNNKQFGIIIIKR